MDEKSVDDAGAGDKSDVSDDDKPESDDKPETPEQRFESRYPQPVHVSDVVGKPMIQLNNTSIGTVRHVVRSRGDKLKLVVPYGGIFGFGRRLVAVPLEAIGSIGTAIVSLDMKPDDFAKAPTWRAGDDAILPSDTPMRVAICRH